MRVIAGTLGGRQFDSPKSFKTHPMSDKARGGLFNILGDVEGLTFLDAFAGSGALSFEAVSRGATIAVAIDNDRFAQKVIANNIHALGLRGKVKLISASANAWLQTSSPDDMFDIVLCDPPYSDLQTSLIARLAERVKTRGLLVLSWPAGTERPLFEGLQQIEMRGYGDATLIFYRKG
ncbi:MAG TPA: RsmD family RNA methyltransferase [Candidatus Saccharimonadales bacterium]|nr:RsmD family RNA methyltransferase [Candidatus Saccharimonadales bacterium]